MPFGYSIKPVNNACRNIAADATVFYIDVIKQFTPFGAVCNAVAEKNNIIYRLFYITQIYITTILLLSFYKMNTRQSNNTLFLFTFIRDNNKPTITNKTPTTV